MPSKENKTPEETEKKLKSPEEKVDDLKEAIKECGFEVEETEEGIKINE